MKEIRANFAEVRAVDTTTDGHYVTLQAIKPGVVDDFGSVWEADTFDKSLAERLPTLCWSHDWTDPLGRGLSFQTSNDGPQIRFEFDDFEAVPQARRAFAQIESTTIRDCSVGFSNAKRRDPTDEETEQFPGVKEIIFEADLDEVSLVLRGAVPGAKVLSLRAAGGSIDIEAVVEIARKKAAGELTSEEAQAAVELLTDSEPKDLTVTAPPDTEKSEPDEPETQPDTEDALNVEIDAALELVDRASSH